MAIVVNSLELNLLFSVPPATWPVSGWIKSKTNANPTEKQIFELMKTELVRYQ
jgi:hypothetical protein